jgi:hypothetical protein
MRFVALSGNTVIGEGVVSRSHIHYVGKRGVSPDLIVPVPFRPGPGVRVVRREEDVAALDLGGGTWIARGFGRIGLSSGISSSPWTLSG